MLETKYTPKAEIERYTVNTPKIAWPMLGPQLDQDAGSLGIYTEVVGKWISISSDPR